MYHCCEQVATVTGELPLTARKVPLMLLMQ